MDGRGPKTTPGLGDFETYSPWGLLTTEPKKLRSGSPSCKSRGDEQLDPEKNEKSKNNWVGGNALPPIIMVQWKIDQTHLPGPHFPLP